MPDAAKQRAALLYELDEVVDVMADHMTFEQANRLAIVLTPDEAQLLAYVMTEKIGRLEFVAAVDSHNQVWYCGKRVMVLQGTP